MFKDFQDFLKLCNKHELRYLVVGGFAVSAYGYPRGTKDLDICIEASPENGEKIATIIHKFGLGSMGLTAEDFIRSGMIT